MRSARLRPFTKSPKRRIAIGACVLVDGAQSVSHMPVDVQSIGCDFFVFSGHKVFGPTGIGVVYGKDAVLEHLDPWQGGGNMIADVTFEKTIYQGPPERFEAGTGNIADAVGLGAALDYVESIGMDVIARYEHELLVYATEKMRTVPGLALIGTAPEKASVLSFTLDGHDPLEVGKALDREGIAVRAGHHCAQPILRRFGLEATVRPSLAFYNTCADVDALVAVLLRLQAGTRPYAPTCCVTILRRRTPAASAQLSRLVLVELVTRKVAIRESGTPALKVVTVARRIGGPTISKVSRRALPSVPAGLISIVSG